MANPKVLTYAFTAIFLAARSERLRDHVLHYQLVQSIFMLFL